MTNLVAFFLLFSFSSDIFAETCAAQLAERNHPKLPELSPEDRSYLFQNRKVSAQAHFLKTQLGNMSAVSRLFHKKSEGFVFNPDVHLGLYALASEVATKGLDGLSDKELLHFIGIRMGHYSGLSLLQEIEILGASVFAQIPAESLAAKVRKDFEDVGLGKIDVSKFTELISTKSDRTFLSNILDFVYFLKSHSRDGSSSDSLRGVVRVNGIERTYSNQTEALAIVKEGLVNLGLVSSEGR